MANRRLFDYIVLAIVLIWPLIDGQWNWLPCVRAIRARVPGARLRLYRNTIILAGTTTFGTQGAVEYICRQSSVEELLLRLPVSKDGEIVPFEALLSVKVTRGVPVETNLVALRRRSQ